MQTVVWIIQVDAEDEVSAAQKARAIQMDPDNDASVYHVGPERTPDLDQAILSFTNVDLIPQGEVELTSRIHNRILNLQQFISEYENGKSPEGMADREVADSLLRWKRELDTIMWCIGNDNHGPYYEAD